MVGDFMKTRTYLKAGFREIRQSKGRFIAIILIVMLGTLLFVGVKTAGPVMQKRWITMLVQQDFLICKSFLLVA